MPRFHEIGKDTVVNEDKIICVKKIADTIHLCTKKDGCTLKETIKCEKKECPENFNYLSFRFGFT